MDVEVRFYRSADRDAVRHLCHATGFMGEPADWYWRDEESFADIWTSYYTDAEPESVFIAERGGEVVGYLMGCVDSRRAWDIGSIAARHAIRRLCLLRPGTAGIYWRTLADVVVGNLTGRAPVQASFHDARWPSHLHINLAAEARGTGAGRALMSAYLDYLRAAGSVGCNVETLAENARAVAFFEASGFVRYGDPEVVPGERQRDGSRLHRQILVQSLLDGRPRCE